MLNDEICKLRDELNKSIEEGKDYDIIYDLSVKLDELIADFYRLKTSQLQAGLQLYAKKYENFRLAIEKSKKVRYNANLEKI